METGDREEPPGAGQPHHHDRGKQQCSGRRERPPREPPGVDEEHLGGEGAVQPATGDRVDQGARGQRRRGEPEAVQTVRRPGSDRTNATNPVVRWTRPSHPGAPVTPGSRPYSHSAVTACAAASASTTLPTHALNVAVLENPNDGSPS